MSYLRSPHPCLHPRLVEALVRTKPLLPLFETHGFHGLTRSTLLLHLRREVSQVTKHHDPSLLVEDQPSTHPKKTSRWNNPPLRVEPGHRRQVITLCLRQTRPKGHEMNQDPCLNPVSPSSPSSSSLQGRVTLVFHRLTQSLLRLKTSRHPYISPHPTHEVPHTPPFGTTHPRHPRQGTPLPILKRLRHRLTTHPL